MKALLITLFVFIALPQVDALSPPREEFCGSQICEVYETCIEGVCVDESNTETNLVDRNIMNMLNDIDIIVKYKQEGMDCTSLDILSFNPETDQDALIENIKYDIDFLPTVDVGNNDCTTEEDTCGINLAKLNDNFMNVNAGNLNYTFSWSAAKAGNYQVKYIDKNQESRILEEGYYNSGTKEIELNLTELLTHDYTYMTPLWQDKILTYDSAFDLNSDGVVDVTDYSIFYKDWQDDTENKIIRVTLVASTDCVASKTWSITPDIYLPIVSIEPRSMPITEPITLTASGAEKIECKINKETYFIYNEPFRVSPDDTVSCRGRSDDAIGPNIIETYPLKRESFLDKLNIFKRIADLISVNITSTFSLLW